MAYKRKTKPAPKIEITPAIAIVPIEPTERIEIKTELPEPEQMTFIPDFRIIKVKTTTALNIRQEPSFQARINGVLPPGAEETLTEIKVIDMERWGKIESGMGWINLRWTAEI